MQQALTLMISLLVFAGQFMYAFSSMQQCYQAYNGFFRSAVSRVIELAAHVSPVFSASPPAFQQKLLDSFARDLPVMVSPISR